MNQSLCPVNIYLGLSKGLSKAFDSLKYDILLSKLRFYGLQSNDNDNDNDNEIILLT